MRPVAAWSAAFLIYVLCLALVDGRAALVVNNVAWAIVPVAAAISAWLTARVAELTPLQRRAWSLIAAACAVWFLGQLIWAYSELFLARPLPFPSLNNLCYLVYGLLVLRAVGWLSDSTQRAPFTAQHLGNLGLIACCLAVTVLIAFFEPIAQAQSRRFAQILVLAHCTFLAAIFFAALYYLWTQHWVRTWIPMLLIAFGTGIYAVGNFVYVHALILKTYDPSGAVNASWVIAFLAFGLAAHLRRLPASRPTELPDEAFTARRTRQVEATIPAMLIVLIVAVGMSVADQVSPRVLVVAAMLMLVFALILGAREAWIQAESQRLTLELRATNNLLRTANRELQESEARVRDLNAHLEERVADRTRQLQSANEELEGFAYAVAHDLKAPLRAIDGFGQLLDDAIRPRGDIQSSAYLTRIRRGATKMARLIDDLLAYSRIERRAFAHDAVILDELVKGVVAESASELEVRDIAIHVDVPSLTVNVDAEALALVLTQLLQNAIKFTRSARPARIDITARRREDRVELRVRDNGIGFDMQYHDQIFKLFHRLHRDDEYQGTGIGLALVRKALERMHGRVRAESAVHDGAVFIVELPMHEHKKFSAPHLSLEVSRVG